MAALALGTVGNQRRPLYHPCSFPGTPEGGAGRLCCVPVFLSATEKKQQSRGSPLLISRPLPTMLTQLCFWELLGVAVEPACPGRTHSCSQWCGWVPTASTQCPRSLPGACQVQMEGEVCTWAWFRTGRSRKAGPLLLPEASATVSHRCPQNPRPPHLLYCTSLPSLAVLFQVSMTFPGFSGPLTCH